MPRKQLTFLLLAFSLLAGQMACSSGGKLEAPPGSHSQPKFKAGMNFFSPEQDIEMGRQSADQIVRETPMLDDPQISGYVSQLALSWRQRPRAKNSLISSEPWQPKKSTPLLCPADSCSSTPEPSPPPKMKANWQASWLTKSLTQLCDTEPIRLPNNGSLRWVWEF